MIIHKSFGLDLGTTNSTASIIKDGKVIYAEENPGKNKTIPSIIAVRKNGSEVYGTLAKNEFYTGNTNSKKSIKREMGKKTTINFGEKEYTPEDISSKIINYCKECLIDTIGKEENVVYDKVVITVPAYFNLAQKDATRKAGELAGLEVQMLLEEPTAAAINYAVSNNIENGLFFVFDLGGGTFDVSILEKTENIPTVLATAGNNFLGGDNFDSIIARYFLEELKKRGNNVDDIEVSADDKKFRLLMFAAENVKKQLSVNDSYNIYFPDIFKDNTGIELSIDDFTRKQFDDLIKDKVEKDIIKECDKALELLEKNHGKTISDITHILMVGGSTKIPYVKKVIKDHYCKTDLLKDVTIYEPDLSVSAGAAFVANSNGYSLEDEKNNILVKMNATYSIDGKVYVSGKIEKGKITKVSIDIDEPVFAKVDEDNTFVLEIDEKNYNNQELNLFNGEECINKLSTVNDGNVDIIAPTPIQNETIAVTIIDVEKGKTEQFPIVYEGTYLPSKTTETFKINEYSNKQIILPIWEGTRKIFNFIIDLPNDAKIGNKLSVTTTVDTISNVTLSVDMDGKKLEGRYEYITQEQIDSEETENYEEIFEERIRYVDNDEEKDRIISQKEDIVRELEEAKANNDETHYANVAQKFEKTISELPSAPVLTEEKFDEIANDIKEKLTDDSKISSFDVDNQCFYGKRYLKKDNMVEAQKCMDNLLSMKSSVDLISNPKKYFAQIKGIVSAILGFSLAALDDPNTSPSLKSAINNEINIHFKEIDEIMKKYDENDNDPEMIDDADRLVSLTARLYQLVMAELPEESTNNALFNGLVSKA
ncbi:MAG: Hsp70 family protein [bacterium]|nr:Hsp70 family protein [bacterium]